jgi:endoribonuclease Dicer
MGTSLWRKTTWIDYCTKNMVIVCTAEVLVQCLMHSFIRLSEISLLIFDEAHHAKAHHSYARIMRDYYEHESDVSKRPRIFGMTASPIDMRGLSADHIKDAATRLEKLLHSKIATISEQTLALNNISRPTEEVLEYAPLKIDQKTPFYSTLKTQFGDFEPFKKYFIAAERIGSELGPWASDVYWSFAFADEQSSKLQIREEYRHNRSDAQESVEKLDAKMAFLKEAADFVQQHDYGLPTVNDSDLSSKVLLLCQWLNQYYERSAEPRCIVFVEQRQTARLLKLVFDHIGGPNLHCDLLIGVNSFGDEHNVSLRNQILTVSKFRRGEINCVFATSVAEEGLDIPQCNLVVRFDLYKTMIGYVQSRGRARHRNSKYLHMVEQGNHDHAGRLRDVLRDEQIMRNFCNGVSSDRRLDEFAEGNRNLYEIEEKLYPSYTDPDTGAKLTYRTSLSILAHFVATLPTPNRDTQLQPTYVIGAVCDAQRTGFQCEVILPACSPVISATGRLETKKTAAKCSAAFMICLELRKKGYLDSNLLPTTEKYLPAMRNALLAVSGKKKGHYPMLIKPSFWKQYGDGFPERLFISVIDVDAGLGRPHQPLGLLTRGQIPHIPSFPIYLANGKASNVVLQSLATPISITSETLEMLTRFTFHIYEDIYNKEYEYDVSKVSYWIAPVRKDWPSKPASSSTLEEIVDMEQVRSSYEQSTWQWTPQTADQDLVERYIIDPLHGGRRFYSRDIAKHLKPQDPVPGLQPRGKKNSPVSILHYSDSRYQASLDISKWRESQPVVEVEKIPFRRNLLAEIEEKERPIFDDLKTYLCVEPLRISKVSKYIDSEASN